SKRVASVRLLEKSPTLDPKDFKELRGRSGGTRTPNPRFWSAVHSTTLPPLREEKLKWSSPYLAAAPQPNKPLRRSLLAPPPHCDARPAHSHRRRHAVAADPPGAALQCSIGLLDHDDEDLSAWLDLTLVARHVSHDRRIGGDSDLLFPVFVFQRQRPTVDRTDDLLDIGIGHRALRLQIPRIMSLSGAAHRFRKDMHLDSVEAAVGLRHRGHSDKRVLFDVRQRCFDDAGDLRIVGDCQFDFGAVAGLDDAVRCVDAFDGATYANRRRILRGGALNADERRNQDRR